MGEIKVILISLGLNNSFNYNRSFTNYTNYNVNLVLTVIVKIEFCFFDRPNQNVRDKKKNTALSTEQHFDIWFIFSTHNQAIIQAHDGIVSTKHVRVTYNQRWNPCMYVCVFKRYLFRCIRNVSVLSCYPNTNIFFFFRVGLLIQGQSEYFHAIIDNLICFQFFFSSFC